MANSSLIADVERAQRETEEAWEPRPSGRCSGNIWRYYFCCVDVKGNRTGCCDPDHLAMHVFFLMFAGAAILTVITLANDNFGQDYVGVFVLTYLPG